MVVATKEKKKPSLLLLNKHSRIDNYNWLRDDSRKNKLVLEHLKKENVYFKKIFQKQKNLQNKLFTEIISRIPNEDCSVPYLYKKYFYKICYEKKKEYATYFRKSVNEINKTWELLLDCNDRAYNKKFYSMGILKISPNNNVISVTEDFFSRGLYVLSFKKIKENKWLSDVIENVSSNYEWSNDCKTIYYIIKHKKTLSPYQVWKHKLGTSTKQDKLVYEEKNNGCYISLYKTRSERYIVISINSLTSSEIFLIDDKKINSNVELFLSRKENHKYFLDHYKNNFYVRSNIKNKDFSIYKIKNDRKSWKLFIKGEKNLIIENFVLFREWIVLEERYMGLTRLRQINWLTKKEKYIRFDDPVSTIWLDSNFESESETIRYYCSSMIIPITLFEINLNNGKKKVLKQRKIKNLNYNEYTSKRFFIEVRDKIKVPVSLIYKTNSFIKGKNPILIYGYGAYGISLDPIFSNSRLSLLDRGFIYALAHVRGGGELGQKWHEDGKLLKKINTFYDFIDVSQGILKKGYGHPSKMFAMGGSAGGLLIGSVINLAPKLFKGVILQVPFVDVLNTMMDESIPLTSGEYEEWGNPNNIDYYRYILKYSPYDQIKNQEYPHILVSSGFYDSQVQYWEPAKWVAKLRELKKDNNILLFFTDMNAGHFGKSGRFESYKWTSIEYAFMIALLKNSIK